MSQQNDESECILTERWNRKLSAPLRASDSPATYGALQMCFDWL